MKVSGLSQLFIQSALIFFLTQSVQAFQVDDAHRTDDLLISYSEKSSLTRTADKSITINIYRTGEVFICIPEYMKRAGHYHVFLEREKLDALWLLLINEKILTFDARAVRDRMVKEQQLLKQSRAVISSVSDKAEMLLEFYPARFWPQGSTRENGAAVKRIAWSGVRWDAEHYPHIESLQMLSEINDIMSSILNRSDLQRDDE